MAKVQENFPHEIYRFIHRPIRQEDQLRGRQFLERYIFGFQRQFEEAFRKIDLLTELYDPAKTPQPRFLKDIVGFTKELDKITNDISDDDLRKLIGLAVPLWKEKGLDIGYKNIIRLFTGKNSRVFGWFDYRYIVGEQGLAQEELGEDSWLISIPGVEETNPSGNVVLLLPFEDNFKDRSIHRNDAIIHGDHQFFNLGATTGSEKYLCIFDTGGPPPPNAGIVEVPNSSKYDFSGDFTIEMFCKATGAQDGLIFSKQFGGKEVSLRYNTNTDEITYRIHDGTTLFTETLATVGNLADDSFRHIALVVDRTNDVARLYLGGTEATPGIAITTLGDPTNAGKIWLGGSGPGLDDLEVCYDNLRMSLSAQYDVTSGTLPVPAFSFIESQAEELDEFFTDVRVVDEGDLNRTLTLRILNLMRPTSERLRVIYIRFFENFQFGKGDLATVVSGSFIDTINEELVLPANAVEVADSTGNADFQDYVLQTRAKIVDPGSRYSMRFLVQDNLNYYRFRMRSDNQTFELEKVVGGVVTPLAAPVSAEIFNDTFYVLTVITDYSPSTNQTLIRCYQDRNTIFELTDNTFEKGTWGVESEAGTESRLSEIEMFLMPLEFDIIEPNQVI